MKDVDVREIYPPFTINVRRIRSIMRIQGINTEELARELGIADSTLSGYLSNPSRIPYRVISKLAGKLCRDKETAADVFFWQNEEPDMIRNMQKSMGRW